MKKNARPSSALDALGLEEKNVGHLKTEPIDHDTDREEHSNDAEMTAHSTCKSLLLIQVQWNPALLSPRSYSHLLITATLFCPGDTLIHFLTWKPRWCRHPVNNMSTAPFWNLKLSKTLILEPIYTANQISYVHLSLVNILYIESNFN